MGAEIWAVVTVAGTSLVAVIGVLWKMLSGVWDDRKEQLDRFEQREIKMTDKLATLSADMANLKGQREGEKFAVEKMVESVTQHLKESREELIKFYKEKEKK